MARILIVEDDETILEAYTFAFLKAGYAVDGVRSGEAAMEKVTTIKPDMILLDMLLLRESGIEFLADLRSSDYKGVPVIVFSNLDSDLPMSEAEKLGINHYLVKAKSTPAEVVAIVNQDLGLYATQGK